MLRVLPVKVRSRELAVCPRSYTRRLLRVILVGASSKVKALVDEGQAIHRAAAKANLMQPRYMTRVRIDVRGMRLLSLCEGGESQSDW